MSLDDVIDQPSAAHARWFRLAVELGGLGFLVFGVARLIENPDLRAGSFGLEFLVLGTAAVASRRFAIALPGRGVASLVTGVAMASFLLRGWEFAVVVMSVGMVIGEIGMRRVAMSDSLATTGHLALATGLIGNFYSAIGGATGAAAVQIDNLIPLASTIVLLPVMVNSTFYLELSLASASAWVDARLTLRWEVVTALAGSALAVVWVGLLTSQTPFLPTFAVGVALVGAQLAYLLGYPSSRSRRRTCAGSRNSRHRRIRNEPAEELHANHGIGGATRPLGADGFRSLRRRHK